MDQLRLFAMPQEGTTSDDYWTPPEVFDAMGLTFDLDVCAPPGGIPWIPAAHYYTQADDGLAQPWHGRVWMNPPYSDPTPWMRKWLAHGNGVCLVQISKGRWNYDLWCSDARMVMTPPAFRFIQGPIYMPTYYAALGDENIEAISRLGRLR